MNHDHVRVVVTDASPQGFEHVPARRISDTNWQLLRSPLYAMGVATGDIVRVTSHEKGEFEIIERGGNVCVQFYLGEADVDDAVKTMIVAKEIALEIEPICGSMDAQTPGLIAFTIPAAVGFPTIERIFASATERHLGAQWQYSNVYDSTTGDSLGWWE